jgi:hypothetical protein
MHSAATTIIQIKQTEPTPEKQIICTTLLKGLGSLKILSFIQINFNFMLHSLYFLLNSTSYIKVLNYNVERPERTDSEAFHGS